MGQLEFRDHTLDFCDRYEQVIKRRHRLGCKGIYKAFLRESNIFKNLKMLSQVDRRLVEQENKKEMEWAISNFPKSVK